VKKRKECIGETWGNIGQWCGLIVCVVGVIVELITHADYGYVILSSSSLIWGCATKIKYYTSLKKGGK